jgi:cellobiose transport system permease protein
MTTSDLRPGTDGPAPPLPASGPPAAERGQGHPDGDRRERGPVRRALSRLDSSAMPYLLVAPFFVLFGVFGLFPIGYTFWLSLSKIDLFTETESWVGLGNYSTLLADEQFWNALRNTVALFLLSSVPQLLIALCLAQVLNRRLRGRTFWRMGVLLPNITSIAAVAIVFNQLFATNNGLVNWVLSLFGVGPIDWHSNQYASWFAISTMVNWRWIGYNALIFLAALQAIPREIYDAAAVDGAGPWRTFWRITVPMIRPTLIFTVVLSSIGGMQLFAEPLLFDPNSAQAYGGAGHEYQTLALYVFQTAFRNGKLGYAAAISWVLFLLIIVVALVNLAVVRKVGRR